MRCPMRGEWGAEEAAWRRSTSVPRDRKRYTNHDLSGWAGALSAWARQGEDVYGFFNSDAAGYAPQNALALHAMLA